MNRARLRARGDNYQWRRTGRSSPTAYRCGQRTRGGHRVCTHALHQPRSPAPARDCHPHSGGGRMLDQCFDAQWRQVRNYCPIARPRPCLACWLADNPCRTGCPHGRFTAAHLRIRTVGIGERGPTLEHALAWKAVSDGSSVAAMADGLHSIVLVRADDSVMEVKLPPDKWVDDWAFFGEIIPLPRGGYLLEGADRLATISPNGQLTTTPLPDGFATLSGTAKSDVYLVWRTRDRDEPGSKDAPHSIYLWPAGASPQLIDSRLVDLAMPADGLADYRRDDGTWWHIDSDGRTARITAATASPPSSLSPSGRELALLSSLPAGYPTEASAACDIEIRRIADGLLLHVAPEPSNGQLAWHGDAIAYVRQDAATVELVVVRDQGVQRVSIP